MVSRTAATLVALCVLVATVSAVNVSPQIRAMQADADRIINFFTQGPGKGLTWNRLANFTDRIGPRISGSQALADGIKWAEDMMLADGLDNVHVEPVDVPHWVRGQESLQMVSPRPHKMAFLGLGNSIGTGGKPLKGEVVVVRSFEELESRASQIPGKIVVFNQQCDWVANPIKCYGMTGKYRTQGAAHASKYGAIATLTRSVTSYSLYTPHTGMMSYGDADPIPAGCVTVEDAEMMDRMHQRGQKIVVQLSMEAKSLPDVTSGNLVAEIAGSSKADEVVLVSGHMDSWDVGYGAVDDGGGAFISWISLHALRQLGLKPKRTVRAVLWTAEEFGGVGGDAYFAKHKGDINKMSLVLESDLGVFTPTGIQFTGNQQGAAVMQQVLQLLAPLNATTLSSGGGGEDIDRWIQAGVPGGSLRNENQQYFRWHHTDADNVHLISSDDIDRCAAVWAVVAYAVANLDQMIPR